MLDVFNIAVSLAEGICDVNIGVVKPLLDDSAFIGVMDRDRIYVVRDGNFEEACFEVSKI